jgi:hypothetical protein
MPMWFSVLFSAFLSFSTFWSRELKNYYILDGLIFDSTKPTIHGAMKPMSA